MIWLLGGYLWLYVHRPFEVWPSLGALQIERGYMLILILAWAVSPGKGGLPNRIHAALTLFTVVLTVTWVASPYAAMPGCTEVVENFAKVAVFYVLVVTTVRDERQLRLLILLFLGAVGVYMAHSLWEFLHGRIQWRMGVSRMIGVDVTYSDPNAFASTLLYALPLVLPFWLERPRRVPRWLLIGFVLCILFCILRTGSRAGFVGLCLLVAIVFLSQSKRKFQAALFGGLAVLIGFVVLSVTLPDDLQNRYLTLIDSSRGPQNAQQSADGRLDGFLHGIRVWNESPLCGHGPGSFQYSTGRGGQAHNLYGQVLSEMGVAGAVALAVLLACFWWNWRETKRLVVGPPAALAADFPYQVSRAITINVILLLVMGWAGHNLFRYNWQWFAAFGAIALHCLRVRAASRARAGAYALPYRILPHARGSYSHLHQGR